MPDQPKNKFAKNIGKTCLCSLFTAIIVGKNNKPTTANMKRKPNVNAAIVMILTSF